MECEELVCRHLQVQEFNLKIPELEEEMFDLQRQIDHALSYGPYMSGMQRSASAMNIASLPDETDAMSINIRIANKLYDRYMRAYDNLDHLKPYSPGQRALHKHIKQAMYDFYLKRRDQLKSTLRRRDSCNSLS
ncbi:uncharacterized protein LOC106012597 [Aplysia californica]|uniref:Uncharacterized protein LOC106012597 n=1 Tax=Aplysia californica TaxID=6500 RepID=A0ABM1A5X7_APLCA|nr:uncharacterized protein LOC106012597 [Aplysia californica]